ncbi:MAG: hypothetical protein J5892_01815 [Bacilli bacterium]|nr:hypothetical protein [Bacilli bacterium]
MKKKIETAEKKNSLFFAVGVVLLLAIVLTWVVKGGAFQGSEFAASDYTRLGLHDIFTIPFYSIYYFVVQITFLLSIAVFYGVVSKTSGYKTLVSKFAKFLNGKEIVFALIISALITIFASFSSQWLICLFFIPFFISVFAEMKMDKVAAFAISFGAILVGVLGATYGTEVLTFFSYYAGANITDLMYIKVIILVLGFIGFNVFTVLRLLSVKKKNNALELVDPIKDETDYKTTNPWPIYVTFILVFVIMVLGFVNWNLFHETTIFTDLLTKINEVKIGKEFFIFKNILGNVSAFGAFPLESGVVITFVATLIMGIIYRIKAEKFVESAIDGIKAFIKPIALVVLAYSVFVIIYMSPFVPTVVNAIMDVDSKLAPFLASVCGMFASIFNVDYGYAAYSLGSYFASIYPKDVSAISIVLTTIYGLMMFVAPTSLGLIFGLQYTGISYKTWLKHIWKFALIMFVILEIIYFIIL